MEGCKIDTYYLKKGQSHSKYSDFFYLNVCNDFKQDGPNIWKGSFGLFTISVEQRGRQSEITENDVTIERNDEFKEDPEIIYPRPFKDQIATAMNKHLDNLYG
ncbi:MAG: hypothetical protein RIM99_14460 [Cyclobacteriaceae bacterium]